MLLPPLFYLLPTMSKKRTQLFEDPADEDDFEPSRDNHCTPEKLEAFIHLVWKLNGRMPTLRELKAEFGGILGPLLDGWELERRGILKQFKKKT